MPYNLVGFLAFCFVGLTAIARALEKSVMQSTDIAWLNSMGISQSITIGFISVPVPNTNIINGIIKIGQLDYTSIFTGNAQLVLYLLYSVTFVVVFAFVLTIIGVGVNAIRTH